MGFLGTRALLGLEIDKNDINKKKERKHEIANQEAALKKDLKAFKQKKQVTLDKLNAVSKKVALTDSQLNIKEKEIERKNNQIDIANDTITQAQKDLDANQEEYEARLRIYYESGTNDYVNLIVNAKDLSDLVYRIHYTDSLLNYNQDKIYTIREQKQLLSEQKDKLTNEVKEKENLYRDIWELRTSYSEDKKEKEKQIKEIQRDIRKTESALGELDREDSEITFFLQNAARGDFSTNFDGSFSCPLRSYGLSSGFGMRRHPIFHRVRMHNGQDLTAPHGTPVMAAGAGRIIFAGWKNGYGNMVMINHGGGKATVYGHLSSILVSVGQDVGEGQTIGLVGSTGWSTGDHLHFEIRQNGKAINPGSKVHF